MLLLISTLCPSVTTSWTLDTVEEPDVRDTDHLLTHIASNNASSHPDCWILTQSTLGKRIAFRELFSKLYTSTAKHYLWLETYTAIFKQFNLNIYSAIRGHVDIHIHTNARTHTQNCRSAQKKTGWRGLKSICHIWNWILNIFCANGNIHTRYSSIYPTRCNVTQFILSGNCSTCFGRYHHPSSGV